MQQLIPKEVGMQLKQLMLVLLIALTSTSLAQDNAVNVVEARPELSALTALVYEIGFEEVLADAEGFTLFAPNDDAFQGALQALDVSADSFFLDQSDARLENILEYHMVSNVLTRQDLQQRTSGIQTMSGNMITISSDGTLALNQNANILETIEVDGGIVHVIDAVLLTNALLQALQNDAEQMQTATTSDTTSSATVDTEDSSVENAAEVEAETELEDAGEAISEASDAVGDLIAAEIVEEGREVAQAAEQTEEAIEQTAENVGQEIQEETAEAAQAAEQAGDAIEQTAENVGQEIEEEAVDAAQAAEQAGDAIEQTAENVGQEIQEETVDAAQATEQAAENLGQEIEEEAVDAAQATEQAAENVEQAAAATTANVAGEIAEEANELEQAAEAEAQEETAEMMTETQSQDIQSQADTVMSVVEDRADLSHLMGAVYEANLGEALSEAGPLTLFAPSNRAFDAALNTLGVSAETFFLEQNNLLDILHYHVVSQMIVPSDLSNYTDTGLETIHGPNIIVGRRNGELVLNGSANILETIETDNGVVHIIDAILLTNALEQALLDAAQMSSETQNVTGG